MKKKFTEEIPEKETASKRLNKYIADFHYVPKTLLISTAANSGVSITSFAAAIDASVGRANERDSFLVIDFLK